jgi:hypothetical protein
MTLSGLHSTILLEISKHLGSGSTAMLALSGRGFYSVLHTEARIKRRLHHLRLVLIRLRFIRMHLGDKRILDPPSNWYFNMSRKYLVMICVLSLMEYFEYTGPPDYLYNFNPECYDNLANLVLNFEEHMDVCVANMFGIVNATPTEILMNFMFNFQEFVEED